MSVPVDDAVKQTIILDILRQLPTSYLLCAARFSCREWKRIAESDVAQTDIWKPRADYFEMIARWLAPTCQMQSVEYVSHTEEEAQNNWKMTHLQRCEYYFQRFLLWSAQKRLCGQWAADYYVATENMLTYWLLKHQKAQRLGESFNEVDTDVAARTVESSREAAISLATETHKNIPYGNMPPANLYFFLSLLLFSNLNSLSVVFGILQMCGFRFHQRNELFEFSAHNFQCVCVLRQ